MERHITLMLMNGTAEDIKTIHDWCSGYGIKYEYQYSRKASGKDVVAVVDKKGGLYDDGTPEKFHYFTIFTDTCHYMQLHGIIGDKLLTTDFADFSNVLDCDDECERRWKDVVGKLQLSVNSDVAATTALSRFLMDMDNPSAIDAIMQYSCYMSDVQRRFCTDRKLMLEGRQDEVHAEFSYQLRNVYKDRCNIFALREQSKMTLVEFSDVLGIPVIQLERWERKQEPCDGYMYDLIVYKLEKEGIIKPGN